MTRPTTCSPGENTSPQCTDTELRLTEHYEIDYALEIDTTTAVLPSPGDELGARRWTSYYCATCHTVFYTYPGAFDHVLQTSGLLSFDSPNTDAHINLMETS